MSLARPITKAKVISSQIHLPELQLLHSLSCHLSGLQRRGAEQDVTREKQSVVEGLKSHTVPHSL